jgi:hypothetical protein
MLKKLLIASALAPILLLARPQIEVAQAARLDISGVVFEDADSDGVFDEGERPLPGVAISDGRSVKTTDERGRYRMQVQPRGFDGLIFVSVPGTHHAADNRFYRRIGDAAGKEPQTDFPGIDFPLLKNPGMDGDGAFMFAFVSDTHAADYRRAPEGITKAYRAVAELKPALVIHGGDIIYDAFKIGDERRAKDQYDLYKNKLAPIIEAPFYHAIGNHDVFAWGAAPKRGPASPLHGKGMFRKYFGPAYYSFNYEHCHFVVLDSIGKTTTEGGKTTYYGTVGEEQLEWLKKDLAAIDPDTPVIVVTHIPMINALSSLYGTRSETVTAPNGKQTSKHQVRELARLLGEVLTRYNFSLALAGHYHTFEEVRWSSNENKTRFIVGGSIAGEWWKGDHRLGRSSWPEGFSVIEVDGDDFAVTYIPYGWKGTHEK